MSEIQSDPWLTIVGVGEDAGLTPAALAAIAGAEVVMGPPRHLALLAEVLGETRAEIKPWPVPFADGVTQLMALAGRRVVALVSGDPFWFGAGSVLADRLPPGAWRAIPGVSVFSLAAARLGWRLEGTVCLGLHAAPLTRLALHLAPGRRLIVTLRDGAAVGDLAEYLRAADFGATVMHVMEALGGPRERLRRVTAEACALDDVDHPVCVALEPLGEPLPLATGRPDSTFDNDGQITKRPVRALTLSALAPRPGEHLWDIGGGSGSIGIEWLMCDPLMRATAVEADAGRAARIRSNAEGLGLDRLQVVEGRAPEALDGLPAPDAVFVGGGLSQALLDRLDVLAPGARLVANAVTLESEALLARAHAARGGSLLRIELSDAMPLGTRRGWKSAYPIVQWSVTL
ncbi:cobalamin biosynthesis bifunctional protein CbiET [Sagittula sp. P11]|uniref:precorrin-6y C5,15-methyltransferase (decarboxylating) subunit CbiE n=1 Tax=Sagittula sp. P11 TaxID=2009329 RepID=UPI000C2D2792|nr:precorrin-6y C5,15-methyltransferase (decarboxylating) subunit CbiE [Sagittula sp. P11]AUC54488.1 cobalamin biosynthesis bifunctional protein CbiET [Sagittula sp. P11]